MKLSLLAREHCLNGLVFTLHETFDDESPNSNLTATQSTQAINSVINALQSWENKLGITMELEKKQGGSYYFHNSTDDPHRRMIYFVDDVEGDGIMNTQITPLRDGICPQTPGGCAFPIPWTRRTDIQIEKRTDYLYNAFGDGANGQIKDFYALILHEIGHAVGLGHDIAYLKDALGNIIIDGGTGEPIIDKKNLMSWQLKGPQNGIMYLEENRINLDDASSSSRVIIGAQKLIAESKSHVWTVDFYDMHGVETLSDVNSFVSTTPLLFEIALEIFVFGSPGAILFPIPFDIPDPQYHHWNDNHIGDWQIVNRCDEATYAVRKKDEDCTISSLYSLPIVYPIEGCPPIAPERDVSSTIQGKLHLYPNPTAGRLTIETILFEGIDIPISHIGVYNNLGRLQEQERIEDASQRTTIDLSRLPAGIYWVVWFSGSGEVIATEQVQKVN